MKVKDFKQFIIALLFSCREVISFQPLLSTLTAPSSLGRHSIDSRLDATYCFNGEVIGGVADDDSKDVATANLDRLNNFLANTIAAGDSLVFPEGETFWVKGGVRGVNLDDVTMVFDGTINFYYGNARQRRNWPRLPEEESKAVPCFFFKDCTNMKFTSSNPPLVVDDNGDVSSSTFPEDGTRLLFDGSGNGGILDGKGEQWWGWINYLIYGEKRPMLFRMNNSKNTVFENIELRSSPYWSFWADVTENLEVRYSKVQAERVGQRGDEEEEALIEESYSRSTLDPDFPHNPYQLGAFNTDGFDVKGSNIYIHNVDVYNQDDSICVKGTSSDIFVEKARASGMGLAIGSIGQYTQVRNITFTDIVMPQTSKGIYFKFRPNEDSNKTSSISDVRCENIHMVQPDTPIWMGPAQQADTPGCVPITWPYLGKCEGTKGHFKNILLKDITIIDPNAIDVRGVGVIITDPTVPMEGVSFENIVVEGGNQEHMYYYCGDNANAFVDCTFSGSTLPDPTYFVEVPLSDANK